MTEQQTIKERINVFRFAIDYVSDKIEESHVEHGKEISAAYKRTRDKELGVIDECF